ncbi:MAG: DUF5719 family protein [Marmoricola sp.]
MSGTGSPPPAQGSARGQVVVVLVLVLLSAGALAVAGTASRATGVRHRSETTTTPAQRELVCPSSDTDTSSFVGLLPGTPSGGSVSAGGQPLALGAGTVERLGPPGHDPLTVTARGAATRGVFGTRAKQVGGVTRCGSPRASWWFVGAGGSPGHFSTLELVNPRTGPAVVDLTVWGRDGQVEGAGLRGISVRRGGTRSLKLADVAPSEGNLAVHVEASRGLVLAAVDDHAVDVRDPKAAPVEEWIPDQGNPSRHQLLSGLPPPSAQQQVGAANPALPTGLRNGASLVIANPGGSAVVARVRLSAKDGAFTPKGLPPTQVPPQSVVSVPLGDLVADPGTAVLVDTDAPVVTGYLVPGAGDLLHAVSALPWRGPAAVALPAGGTKTLLLTALTGDGSATVTQLGPKGAQLARTMVAVPGRSTIGSPLRPGTASVVVSTGGSGGRVAGSVLVDRGSAYSALPLTPVLAALRVPEVRPAG